MTISSTTNRSDAAGNGVTTAFSTGFKFFDEGHLKVIVVTDSTGAEALQTLTTHYTVTGAGLDAGGTVTMVTAPATGETLVIIREQPYTQGLDLEENDDLPSESLEEQLDKNVILSQQLLDALARSVQLPDGFTDAFDLTLPVDVNTAEAVIAVNAGATAFEMKTLVALGALALPLAFSNGGTGASYANLTALLTAWGLLVGTDIQAHDADTAKIDVIQPWTADQYFTPQTATTSGAVIVDFSTGNYVELTLSGAATSMTLNNMEPGGTYDIRFSGAFTVTGWAADDVNDFTWPGDVEATLGTTEYTLVTIKAGNTTNLISATNFGA